MNAIQKAIDSLRTVGGPYNISIADELEALLKQEPIYQVYQGQDWRDVTERRFNLEANDDDRRIVYENPVTPCDLKALVEDVRQYAIDELARQTSRNFAEATFSGTFNADAIIAKHTGGK